MRSQSQAPPRSVALDGTDSHNCQLLRCSYCLVLADQETLGMAVDRHTVQVYHMLMVVPSENKEHSLTFRPFGHFLFMQLSILMHFCYTVDIISF